MVLAWVNNVREGPKPEQLTFLRLSYRLGPNEGWIAVRRNRLLLAMFPGLPSDLADAAVSEFGRMVDSWLYWETIAIFTGPGWPIRDRLLASLRDVGERQREAFAIQLYAEGYDVTVISWRCAARTTTLALSKRRRSSGVPFNCGIWVKLFWLCVTDRVHGSIRGRTRDLHQPVVPLATPAEPGELDPDPAIKERALAKNGGDDAQFLSISARSIC